jgi:hypothetical protein
MRATFIFQSSLFNLNLNLAPNLRQLASRKFTVVVMKIAFIVASSLGCQQIKHFDKMKNDLSQR